MRTETTIHKGKRIAVVRQRSRGLGLDRSAPGDSRALHRSILSYVSEAIPEAHVIELPGGKATPVICLFCHGRRTVFIQANCRHQVVTDERTRDLAALKVRHFDARIVQDLAEAKNWLRSLNLRDAA